MFCESCQSDDSEKRRCRSEECQDHRRKIRQACFDYMICLQMEEQFKEEGKNGA